MIRIIIIRNLIILKGEIMTFHYMVMANHAIYNRMLMEILEETGLTAGQPKSSGLSGVSRRGQPEGDCGTLLY